MKKKIIITVIILVAIAGIVFGLTMFNRNGSKVQKYEKAVVDRGDIVALVDTTGTLNPVTIVDVGSQVSGKIAKIYVDFNSQVKEGQVIAELDQSTFITRIKQNEANFLRSQASVEKARVNLENTKKKYERIKSLFEKNLVSYEEFETIEAQYYSAKSDLRSAEAQLEQAQAQLDSSRVDLTYTIIKSPIDGIVISRNVNVGQTVAASFQAPVLFQIANDLTKMQVECSVDEADIGKVKEGQKVRFTVDAFPEDTFTGVVRQVRYSPQVVQNVVTYSTIVDVDNPEMKLRPGMTAIVSIIVGEAKNALRVPNAALRFTPDLSPEEMRAIFEAMRPGRQQARRQPSQTGGQPNQPASHSGFRMDPERMRHRARNMTRVWVEDENGKLRMLFFKPGVTDNVYTEVIGGNLEEGQEVIIGENETEGGSRRSLRRSMMFMRR
ncbi:MAG: efflux RND transporter periplasmic adaptor subunit [Candidatus Aminicenantales bacterium]